MDYAPNLEEYKDELFFDEAFDGEYVKGKWASYGGKESMNTWEAVQNEGTVADALHLVSALDYLVQPALQLRELNYTVT